MNDFKGDFIQYSDEKVKDETKHLALYFTVHIFLYIVLLFFLIFFVWYTVFISSHSFYAVKGVSMMPMLNAQITEQQLENNLLEAQEMSFDAVYVDRTTDLQVFDIIVVSRPNEEAIIKRLMAVGGDYITIVKGESETGEECFFFYRIPKGTDLSTISDDEQFKVLENGENGYQIYDSETLWIHHDSVLNPVETFANEQLNDFDYERNFFNTFLRSYQDGNDNFYLSPNGLVYVRVPENQVFYMGDNREYSSDCRLTGFCDKSAVVGRAEFVVYNYNFANRLWEVVKFYFREMEEFFAR